MCFHTNFDTRGKSSRDLAKQLRGMLVLLRKQFMGTNHNICIHVKDSFNGKSIYYHMTIDGIGQIDDEKIKMIIRSALFNHTNVDPTMTATIDAELGAIA